MYYTNNVEGIIKCIGQWNPIFDIVSMTPWDATWVNGKKYQVKSAYAKIPCCIDVAVGGYDPGHSEVYVVVPDFNVSFSILPLETNEVNPTPVTAAVYLTGYTDIFPLTVIDDNTWARSVMATKRNLADLIAGKLNTIILSIAQKNQLKGEGGKCKFRVQEKTFNPYQNT